MDDNYGRKIYRLLVGLVVVGGAIWYFNWSSQESTPAPREGGQAAEQSCTQALHQLIADGQNGVPLQGAVIDSFARQCPADYATWTDYQSIKGMVEITGADRCADLAQYRIGAAAIELARRDGLCVN